MIVGAVLGGLRTAERLRRLGYDGPLTLIGAEAHEPYDRPPLSKSLLVQEDDPERGVPLRTAPYADLALDMRLGVRVTGLDTARKTVVLDGGRTLDYGRLVIATGLRARTLPALAGAHVLRSLDDCMALRAGMRGARHVTVVGGGVLGCEIAAAARAGGTEVTLVELLDRPMAQALGPHAGEVVAALHRDRGVVVRCGRRVAGAAGGRVRLDDGSVLPPGPVVAAVGAVPDTGWLDGSGVRLADGVVCDRTGRTSAPDAWAVGDVARIPDPRHGTVRLEHWTNAADTAALVAHNLLAPPGERREPAGAPYFWSDQYDVKIQCLGLPRPDDDFTIAAGDPGEFRFLGLYSDRGTVTGAVAFGMPGPLARCRAAVAAGASVTDLLSSAPWNRAPVRPAVR
ncbi:NAD(P)/FAD-dependent oxidoreductase [Actinomadura sp. LD22]|uniref:NAD(P)/FAD-dependent oxidoreductase n=2 Tax=Actinomadura physcomitrii TaxID=2650748 RepID=A0A6I4MLN0_9ACTN|nr:NAD(P)/FAD-dependent oxidoreductase [Actinomadura physcomitrii]